MKIYAYQDNALHFQTFKPTAISELQESNMADIEEKSMGNIYKRAMFCSI